MSVLDFKDHPHYIWKLSLVYHNSIYIENLEIGFLIYLIRMKVRAFSNITYARTVCYKVAFIVLAKNFQLKLE